MAEPRPVRVLHIISNLDVGGAQEVVRSLAPALAAMGCHVSVVTLRDGPLRDRLEDSGIPVHIVGGRTRSLVRDLGAARELLRIAREIGAIVERERPDVVQTHLLSSLDFLVLAVARLSRGSRVAWTYHNARVDLRADQLPAGDRWLGAKRRAYRALYHHASRFVGAMIAVSSEVGAAVRRDLHPAPGRLVVIPNGVDVQRYEGAGDREATRRAVGVPLGAELIVCVAKLHDQKGHRFLLDAFAGIAAERPRATLALVGDGPMRGELVASANRLGLADRVCFLGVRPDIPAVLAASDVFVLASLWEGLPMALLEAMASGLPVIATRVSGTEEVLANGDVGILVEPADSGALADAMRRLLDDAPLRSRLGTAGRDRVTRRYSVEVQARRHLDLYRRWVPRAAP